MKLRCCMLLLCWGLAPAAEVLLADRAAQLDQVLRVREQFQSNTASIRDFTQHSNTSWAAPRVAALRETNTALVDLLLTLTNALGGDFVQLSETFLLAADQYFLESPAQRREEAFEYYGRILSLELEALRAAKLQSWEGRTNAISSTAFNRALLMDRYRLKVTPALGAAEAEEKRWSAFYRGFHAFYTNGYLPSPEFRVSMGVFYLLEGDLRRARIAFEANRFEDEDYWADRLAAAEFQRAPDAARRWKSLRQYVEASRAFETLRVSPGAAKVNLAVALLGRRDPLGRDQVVTLDELPADEALLQKALELLEEACADPMAAGPARLNQGLIYLTLERWPNAVFALEDALRRWPDPRAYYALALTELRLQNGPRAYRWFEELNRIDPNRGQQDPLFLNNFVCAALGDTNAEVRRLSLSRINRAVELDDQNPVIHLTRGELLASTGNPAGATNAFRRAQLLVGAITEETYTNALPWFALRETNRVPQRLDELKRRLEQLFKQASR